VANFSFTVDTREMADGIHSVTPHIDATTGAVISMQTAVIVAERNAAEHICANVNRGFFSLIRSQISQKIAICRSQVEARLLELRDQSQKLLSVKTTMQRDFQVIAARYTKLFRSLDVALLSRIHEVDMPLMDLVQKDVARMQGRTRALQATVPVNQLESITSNQKIAASSTRAKTSQLIGIMSQFIQESNAQNRLTESILSSESGYADLTVLLPICIVDCDNLQVRQRQWQYYTPIPPSTEVAARLKDAIERNVITLLQRIEWDKQPAEDRDNVVRCFGMRVKEAQLNERVRLQITRMLATSEAEALIGVRA
jgi:hypothetical protein